MSRVLLGFLVLAAIFGFWGVSSYNKLVSLDASPGVIARSSEIQTPTPGFTAAIYASAKSSSQSPASAAQSLKALGWVQLAPPHTIGARTTIPIDASGVRYSRYLIWITKLPPGRSSAEISEITLFK